MRLRAAAIAVPCSAVLLAVSSCGSIPEDWRTPAFLQSNEEAEELDDRLPEVSGQFGKEPDVGFGEKKPVQEQVSGVVEKGDGENELIRDSDIIKADVVEYQWTAEGKAKKTQSTYEAGAPILLSLSQLGSELSDGMVNQPVGSRMVYAFPPQDPAQAQQMGQPSPEPGSSVSVLDIKDRYGESEVVPGEQETDGGGDLPKVTQSGDALTYWSHSPNLEALNKRMIEKFESMSDGVPVEYSYQQTDKMGQALQLAKQSDQLPDVTTNVGLELPVPALVKDGWFGPMQLSDEALEYIGEENLVEGIHKFDGEIYSFPGFTTKQYFTINWFNKELVESAGLDPESPPETYDEFRAACRAVQSTGDGISGWVANLGQTGRVTEQINYLAQGAGFEGLDGVEFRTGEVAYHSEPYLTAIEFLLSLEQDGLLMPGSIGLIDNEARSRWATGTVGYFFDGPWCTGVVETSLAEFSDKVGSGPMIRPEKSNPVSVYRGPQGGMIWVTGASDKAADAGRFLSLFASPEYAEGIAEGMGQPPADLSVVDRADVHPAYRQAMSWFQEDCFVAPVPIAKNSDVSAVEAETRDVSPGLPEIVQGVFSGDVTDLKGALKELSDKVSAERERALGVARSNGAQVSMDDFTFPDWQPRTDYGPDSY